jgi:hypothetical protein
MPGGFFMCKRCGDVLNCNACLLCGQPLCPKYHGVHDDDGDVDGCPHKSYALNATCAPSETTEPTESIIDGTSDQRQTNDEPSHVIVRIFKRILGGMFLNF